MKHGVLNVLKPPGMTSHDVVSVVRRARGTKRVGHTGTLDPAASGVLPICVGHATRLAEYLQSDTKIYRAEMSFGFETDTLDALGQIIERGDAAFLTETSLAQSLEKFRGAIEQTPPMYSALKRDGKKLYELARAGETIEIAARPVTISRLELLRFESGPTPRAWLDIECSSGTYIRSLVRDIGQSLGVPATMTFLVRTQSGRFSIENAVLIEDISIEQLIPFADCARWCVAREIVSDALTKRLSLGQKTLLPPLENEGLLNDDRQLVLVRDRESTIFVLALPAVIEATAREGGLFAPDKVFLPDNSTKT